MEIKKVSNRGYLFTFSEMDQYSTNVYLINGKNRFFLCDTFLGPSFMKLVQDFAYKELGEKPFVIFNSHFHWDHIWGNSYFENSLIISHILTRERIIRNGKKEITKHQKYWEKNNQIKPPDCTFQEKILFPEDSVEFFFSPGHTKDSSSCFDAEDGILFVGDNLEDPIPYLESPYLEDYEFSLRQYKLVPFQSIVPGHGSITNINLLNQNHRYISDLLIGEGEKYKKEPYKEVHTINMHETGNQFLEQIK